MGLNAFGGGGGGGADVWASSSSGNEAGHKVGLSKTMHLFTKGGSTSAVS